jgi:hypothetical protein
MAQLQTVTIQAPGFLGLNTQDSPLDIAPEYAATANNCVIDRSGRIAARKGFSQLTDFGEDPSIQIEKIGYYSDEVGNTKVYSCSSSGIYSGTTNLTSEYDTSVTDSDWEMAQLDNVMYFFQSGHDALSATEGGSVSTVTFSKPAGSPALENANVVLSAFGRLWVAALDTDKQTVYFSDNLDGTEFNDGNAGSIDVSLVWPDGKDEIVALAAHNGFLIIFGSHSILVYSGPEDPGNSLVLEDTVSGVGCVSRNTVQVTGQDLMFLSKQGVASFGRVIQEKSIPGRAASGTVRDDVIDRLCNASPSTLRSVYSQEEGFYAIGKIDSTKGTADYFVFDMRRSLETGGRRATFWPSSPFLDMHRNWRTGDIYVAGEGVGTYSGYNDYSGTYQMSYYTHQLDFGDATVLKFLKKVRPVIIGTSDSTATIRWGYDFSGTFKGQALTLAAVSKAEWGVAEWGVDEFGTGTAINTLNVNTTGSGTQAAVGIDVTINGAEFSIQELSIYSTIGRKAW